MPIVHERLKEFPGYPPGSVRPLMQPEGNGSSGILVCAEALGEHEEVDRLPLRPYAEAGSVFERALHRAGLTRESLTITNLVWYRPPRNWLEGAPWEESAIRACRSLNDELIQRVRPRVILALGGLAQREFTGLGGPKAGIMMTRGFVVPAITHRTSIQTDFDTVPPAHTGYLLGGEPIPVVGTLHPSFLRRGSKDRQVEGPKGKTEAAGGGTQGMALLGVLIRDLQLAQSVALGQVGKFTYHDYKLGATLAEWAEVYEQVVANPEWMISYDFETQDSLQADDESEMVVMRRDVTQVQVSLRPGHALVSPWTPEILPVLKALLESPNPKLDWNGRKFDRPILRDMGIRTDLGEWHDGMDCIRGDVKVRLWTGGSIRMDELVRSREPAYKLVGMDESGKQIPLEIIGWHERRVDHQDWIRIQTDGTRQSIHATPEHKVLTREGWKRTDAVRVGDEIPLPNRGGDDFIRGAIYGDGHYSLKERTLMIQHSSDQIGWAQAKAKYLGVEIHAGRTEQEHPIVYLSSICSRKWRRIYNKEGKRIFTPPSDRTLAVWYCDDGNLAGNGRPGSTWLGRIRMPLDKFADSFAVWAWFQNEFGDTAWCAEPAVATLGKSAVDKFMARVAEWVHPSMEYKLLPEARGKYNGWMDEKDPQWAEVISVGVDPRHGKRYDTRYCVSVDHPTERFFTEGGMVHNCWHHAQPDLPRGLQFATSFFCPEVGPWKHLSGSQPLWYGALDVDMPHRIFQGLNRTLAITRHPVSGVSLWTGYKEQVVDLAPVLDRMSTRGIPVDEDRREALDVEFSATLERLGEEMQGLFPEELKGLHPEKGFVRPPEEVMVECWLCEGSGKSGSAAFVTSKRTRATKCSKCEGKGKLEAQDAPEGVERLVKRVFEAQVKCSCEWAKKGKIPARIPPNCPECSNTGKRLELTQRWARVLPFLPGSWQQVLKYVKWAREADLKVLSARYLHKHPEWLNQPPELAASDWASAQTKWRVPRDHKTHKETTAEPELRRLAAQTGDPLLPKVLEFREVQKMRGTYVQGWKPSDVREFKDIPEEWKESFGEDGMGLFVRRIGRVHPNFGFKPATAQLSSDSPNAQNFIAHGTIAPVMQAMISTQPDRVLVSFDYKSFHVLTLGFEAKDPLYMRAARIDMHSFFALAGLLRVEDPQKLFDLPDEELRAKLKWYRKSTQTYPAFGGATFEEIRNQKAKRCILGIGFGQGARSMVALNPESFAGVGEAQGCLDMLNSLFPLPAKWRDEVRFQADRDGCLVSRHGFVRRFFDVFQRKPVQDTYQPKGGEVLLQSRENGRKWLVKPGDDSEAAIAFLPANDAFGTIRQVMVRLDQAGWAERFGLINQIHDSLVFDCPRARVDECLQVVREEMERPNPRLTDPLCAPGGLSVQVDAKLGPSLAEMKEVLR